MAVKHGDVISFKDDDGHTCCSFRFEYHENYLSLADRKVNIMENKNQRRNRVKSDRKSCGRSVDEENLNPNSTMNRGRSNSLGGRLHLL